MLSMSGNQIDDSVPRTAIIFIAQAGDNLYGYAGGYMTIFIHIIKSLSSSISSAHTLCNLAAFQLLQPSFLPPFIISISPPTPTPPPPPHTHTPHTPTPFNPLVQCIDCTEH